MEDRRSLREWGEIFSPYVQRAMLVDLLGVDKWQEVLDIIDPREEVEDEDE